jgi:hypothetical protein
VAERPYPATRAEIVMSPVLSPSFVAFLRQGGVGGANRRDPRMWRSARFAPMPPGTDTARPAGQF